MRDVRASSRWIPGGEWRHRARGARFFFGLVLLIAGLTIGLAFAPASSRTPAVVIGSLTLVWMGWAYFWRPQLIVRLDEIEIINPLSRHRVPWEALIDVETRFMLTLVTPQGRYAAQAAPAPGGRASFRSSGPTPGERPSDLVHTDSGVAARVIRGHWQDLVEAQVLDHLDDSKVPHTRHDRWIAVVAGVGVVLTVVAWLLG